MHIIQTEKAVVCFTETNEQPIALKIQENKILFSQKVALDGTSEEAELIVLQKDDPTVIISARTSSSMAPSAKAFIHTECRNFVQGQTFYAAVVKQRTNDAIDFLPCMVMDIVPNGYLR